MNLSIAKTGKQELIEKFSYFEKNLPKKNVYSAEDFLKLYRTPTKNEERNNLSTKNDRTRLSSQSLSQPKRRK